MEKLKKGLVQDKVLGVGLNSCAADESVLYLSLTLESPNGKLAPVNLEIPFHVPAGFKGTNGQYNINYEFIMSFVPKSLDEAIEAARNYL